MVLLDCPEIKLTISWSILITLSPETPDKVKSFVLKEILSLQLKFVIKHFFSHSSFNLYRSSFVNAKV